MAWVQVAAAQPGEIGGDPPFPRATAVFVEGHIQDPVQGVLDGPVAATGCTIIVLDKVKAKNNLLMFELTLATG